MIVDFPWSRWKTYALFALKNNNAGNPLLDEQQKRKKAEEIMQTITKMELCVFL